jgi:hypothetical protein
MVNKIRENTPEKEAKLMNRMKSENERMIEKMEKDLY